MATATTLPPTAVPGLYSVLTKAELEEATTLYNTLPPDDDNLPKIPDHIRDGAQQLIRKFGVTSRFCFHLLHGHGTLEKGTVMHGQRTTGFNGEGTCPAPIDQLDLTNMRGQIWILDAAAGTFQPYEFRAGPPERMTANDNAFVAAFKDFLIGHELTKTLGLELLPHTNLREHIFRNSDGINYGTMLIPTEFSKLAQADGIPECRTTAWGAGGGSNELKGEVVSHQERQGGLPHYFQKDGKLRAWEETEDSMLATLRESGAIE
ncbi:hypothetical protein CONLIGDRAFT_636743 [Coniochaeta ligniaria NRRL 30616]|uniref:Uncharacterized protein n=1 Tax=Coniochaeta ligniaria NRRL 30616 TaxID=1408157 RepID=A0A1J7IAW9_9PEZI|nr:hypothetical protein CONLIGDRAFT_636743 [Coniochaeta ligniaria NRRL 30616]